ncbi:MAG: 50S ribosomal protein L5 [Thermoplasmata archaeon]
MDNAAVEVGQEQRADMRRILIRKVAVNCSLGESGVRVEKAGKILQSLTNQAPRTCRAKKTIRSFGIQKGEPIGVMVTLRKRSAEDFLKRALSAVNNRVRASSFDDNGGFSFGIDEHLDIPGTKYDPSLGIIGMDVTVCLDRPGSRVARRRRRRSKVGRGQKVTAEEARAFLTQNFGVEIWEKQE